MSMEYWDEIARERRAYVESRARQSNAVGTVIVCGIVALFVWACVVVATL